MTEQSAEYVAGDHPCVLASGQPVAAGEVVPAEALTIGHKIPRKADDLMRDAIKRARDHDQALIDDGFLVAQ